MTKILNYVGCANVCNSCARRSVLLHFGMLGRMRLIGPPRVIVLFVSKTTDILTALNNIKIVLREYFVVLVVFFYFILIKNLVPRYMRMNNNYFSRMD